MPEYQTRSDGNGRYSGLHYFPSLDQAYAAWQEDPSIWKISWDINGEHYRFRPKFKKDQWNQLSEVKLVVLSDEYRDSSNESLFWIRQSVEVPHFNRLNQLKQDYNLAETEFENLCLAEMILEVVPDNQFINKHG